MTASPDTSLHHDVTSRLQAWVAPPTLTGIRDEYLMFLKDGGDAALDRDGGPQHLTASCFIFDPPLTHVLLCFHRKGQFWVQVGGHIEASDNDLVGAALREAHEESGLDHLTLIDGVIDLDRHDLGSAFGRCHTHWDVGVAALSPLTSPQVSDESEHVQWFPVNALPSQMAGSVSQRISVMLDQLGRTDTVAPTASSGGVLNARC